MPHLTVHRLLLALAGGLAACGQSTGPDAAPAALERVSGDQQEAFVFTVLPEPLQVRATDGEGRPMPGVTVTWSASAGTLSTTQSVTNASGMAATVWTFGPGPFAPGMHHARATVSALPPVEFTAWARRGTVLEGVSIRPSQVNVASGAASVDVTVQATTDFGDVIEGVFRFGSPSGQVTAYTPFARISGTGYDGTWRGTVQVPQNAESGAWLLEVTLQGTRERVSWFAGTLQTMGFPYQLTVVNNAP
jgi:hypothetical protein